MLILKDIVPPIAKDSQNEDLDRMLSVLTRPLNIEISLGEMSLLFILILPESMGGLAWPDMLSTFFVNSSGPLENALAQFYAVANSDAECYEVRKLFSQFYDIISAMFLSLNHTKRSAWSAMKNVYSVSVKKPGGAKQVLRRYAMKEMIRVCEDEELGMSSIIKPQLSSSLKSVLDWLCSSCVLDASFARTFASGLPENARETHLMKFMASLVTSGKRDRFFRTILLDMIKADVELMTYTSGKVIESTRKTFRKIRHFLLPARLPSRITMIAFERQSKADNFKFANQVYGHPTEQMSDVSSTRLRSQLDVHIDEAGIVDPLDEGFPGICTSKFPSKQSESSHSGANAAFASAYFVEPGQT